MKKIISLLLAVLMIAGISLTACDSSNTSNQGEGAQNVTGDEAQGGDTGGGAEAAETRISPNLPEANFNGHVFTVLANRDESDDRLEPDPREITVEVENAEDPIKDAVYKRNAVLKDKYNIDFAMVTNTDENSVLRKTVNSGDSTYDAVIMFNNNVPTAVNGGYLTNVANLTYIDLDKPWWDPAVNSMSIDNKNYLLAGDMLILDNEATNALLFNKDLMATLGMELPYNLVKEGKWTMDAMNELVKGASSDLNGDGVMKPDDDRWGFVCYRDTLHALLVSGGGTLAVKDKDDLPYMDFASPRNLAVIEKCMDIMYNKQDVLNIQSDIADGGTNSANWLRSYHGAFEENRALFMWVRMRVVEKFRGMDANFGIIPLPKFDEAQENYCSVVNPYTGVLLGVPKSAGDFERSSIILEAMAAESKYTLQPAYYDVVLQRKFARDEESSEMLDIIFGNRVYDVAGIYFQDTWLEFIRLCEGNSRQGDRNIVSYYDRRQNAIQRNIDRLVERFENLD